MLKIVRCAWEKSDVSSSVQDFHRLHLKIATSAAASIPKEVRAYPERGSGPVSEAHLERGLCLDLLTHWGRVTHICVSDLTSIGSDNGLSPFCLGLNELNHLWINILVYILPQSLKWCMQYHVIFDGVITALDSKHISSNSCYKVKGAQSILYFNILEDMCKNVS